jgi:hypothetical protein
MVRGACPNGDKGCLPRENKFCRICSCAHSKGVALCFECPEFPCPATKEGPIAYDYCRYMAGKEQS